MNVLTGKEVAEHLRRALRREIPLTLMPGTPSWYTVFAGDVKFMVGDWSVTFFNDCNELDYCDSADTPDGRHGELADWYADNVDEDNEPLNLLTQDEHEALEALLQEAE